MIKKILFLILLSANFLFALSLKQLEHMPKSIERDFYIWRFMQKASTTKDEANRAIKLRYITNSKLKKAYYQKTGIKLTTKKAKISDKAIDKYNKIFSKLKNAPNFQKEWLKLSPKNQLFYFNMAGRANRAKLDCNLDKQIYNNLTKHKTINQFIYRAKKENLKNILYTIYHTRPTKHNKINYNNLMDLGFDCIINNNANAKYFFYNAIYKAKDRFSADRAIFWVYMATNEKKYLNKLAKSYDYNIYKLIALDFLKQPYPKPATLSKITENKIDFDISNPIAWARLKRKIFSGKTNLYKLAKNYASKTTMGYYYYILNKASRDTKQYFPIVYKQYIKDLPINKQAMILAIARQESRFIPSAISRSFAVGLMQFMPFLVKHIAKQRKENVTVEDMFKPEIAIKFANTHLDYLNKWLDNPLFVAYAYNAGIGYTRRMLRKKDMFKNREFEPYLSMEMLDNNQANQYGKKVLANYVIYKMLLDSPVKITTILNKIIQ